MRGIVMNPQSTWLHTLIEACGAHLLTLALAAAISLLHGAPTHAEQTVILVDGAISSPGKLPPDLSRTAYCRLESKNLVQ
jgi:hypothetical protein